MSADADPSWRRSDTLRLRTTRIGMVGCGALGSLVARILREKAAHLTAKTGRYLQLARVVELDPVAPINAGLSERLVSPHMAPLLEDDEIDVVLSLTGGDDEEDRVVRLIEAGKSVVLANPALVASRGAELVQLARERDVTLSFSAAVGGGMPLVSSLRDSLVANDVIAMAGVLSVTANLALAAMESGLGLDEALSQSSVSGYAERDPYDDADGQDTAHKLVVLANLLFHRRVRLGDVYIEGITELRPGDLALALALGHRVKLLATGQRAEGDLDLRVHPALVPIGHPLSGINGASNGLYLVGDCCGPLLFSGSEAGPIASASAIVGDLVNVALGREQLIFRHGEVFPVTPSAIVKDILDHSGGYLLILEGLVGEEEAAEIASRCEAAGLAVVGSAIHGALVGLLIDRAGEAQMLALARTLTRERNLPAPARLLRVIDPAPPRPVDLGPR